MNVYFGTALRTLLALVVLAGGVNVVVDPSEQLLRAHVGGEWFERYAAALADAPYGLPYVGAGRERELKFVLGAAPADCHLLGSSRASQLSSVRDGAIRSLCPELVNLWVPGGSLEDLTVLADRFLTSGTPQLVMAIDPWMLAFGSTRAWRIWGERYDRARSGFGLDPDTRLRTPEPDRILAAFSLPAFLASLSLVARHGTDLDALYRPPVPRGLEPFDLRRGHPEDVALADGSRVYTREVLADARAGRMQRLRTSRVPREVEFDPRALEQLDAMLEQLLTRGREVVLLRVPFHPDVLKAFPERVALYVEPAERLLDALAARHAIARYGSYDPHEVDCRPGEFKDLLHPLPECLDRIEWQRPTPRALRAAAR